MVDVRPWWEQLDPALLAYARPAELEALYQAALAELRDLDREATTDDPVEWCRRWLPNSFTLPAGPHHARLLGMLGARPSGVRGFVGAPRGGGKTTAAFRGTPLRAIATGSHTFCVICAVNQQEADRRLALIRSIAKADGSPILRAYPQLELFRVNGRPVMDQTSEVWLNGGRVVAIGAGAPFRGLVRETDDGATIRPDLLIFDDIETAEQARSKLRTDRLEEWIFAELGNLGGPGEHVILDVLGIGTTIDVDAVATRALRRTGRFAGWRTFRYPAEGVADGEGGVVDVRERKPLPWPAPADVAEGERVAMWPEGLPLGRLDRLLTPGDELFIGQLTYAQEYLLDPQSTGDRPVQAHMLRYGRPPEGLTRRTLGVDPAASLRDRADRSAGVQVGLDPDGQTIWVVAAWASRLTMRDLFDRIELVCKREGAMCAYEAVGGFAWGEQELRDRRIPFRPYKPVTDALSRFLPVALLYEQHQVVHDYALQGTEFEAELLGFPGAAHDDYVAALSVAVRHVTSFGEVAAAEGDEVGDEYTAERRSRLW